MRSLLLCLALLYSAVWTTSAKDPCECLNWKHTYKIGQVLCGEGLEFQSYIDPADKSYESLYLMKYALGFEYHEFCASFFHEMDNNLCVNVEHHTYDVVGKKAAQWCYVSKECRDLNGGFQVEDKQSIPEMDTWMLTRWLNPNILVMLYPGVKMLYPARTIPRHVSVKICTRGKDSLLGDMPVMDVLEMGKKMDAVIGFVAKEAYPMARKNGKTTPRWADIKDAVEKGDIEKLPAVVRTAVKDKRPIVIDVHPQGNGAQRILDGREVYELDRVFCDENATGCGQSEMWPFKRGRDMPAPTEAAAAPAQTGEAETAPTSEAGQAEL